MVCGLTIGLQDALGSKYCEDDTLPPFYQPLTELNGLPLVQVLAALKKNHSNEFVEKIVSTNPQNGMSSQTVVTIPNSFTPSQ
jgi:hypothetical protein